MANFVSTPFVLILYTSCVGEGLKMRIMRIMFSVYSFCRCFAGEPASDI